MSTVYINCFLAFNSIRDQRGTVPLRGSGGGGGFQFYPRSTWWHRWAVRSGLLLSFNSIRDQREQNKGRCRGYIQDFQFYPRSTYQDSREAIDSTHLSFNSIRDQLIHISAPEIPSMKAFNSIRDQPRFVVCFISVDLEKSFNSIRDQPGLVSFQTNATPVSFNSIRDQPISRKCLLSYPLSLFQFYPRSTRFSWTINITFMYHCLSILSEINIWTRWLCA